MRTLSPSSNPARPLLMATVVLWITAATPAHAVVPKQEAAALSVVAGAKAKSGDYKLCAEMYAQCYRLDPSFLGYLYSAARCAQKNKQLDLAERHYRAFMLRAPKEHPLRPRADKHMAEIMAERQRQAARAAAAQKASAERAAATQKTRKNAGKAGDSQLMTPKNGTAPRSTRTWLGWAGVGSGLVLGAVGAVLLLRANSDAAALRDDLKLPAGSKLIQKLSYGEATSRRDQVASTSLIGGTAVGVGAALAAAGVFLWLTDDGPETKTSLRLSPIPGRYAAVWEFRW